MGKPTFCLIHLKIHECSENTNRAISSANEIKIKAKMSRMLNPTIATVESVNAEKGTIQYILQNAKKNNALLKSKLGLETEEGMSTGVDENDIKAKMARLRAAITGHQPAANSPALNSSNSGLREIIDHAYQANRHFNKNVPNNKDDNNNTLSAIILADADLDHQLNPEMTKKQLTPNKQKKSGFPASKSQSADKPLSQVDKTANNNGKKTSANKKLTTAKLTTNKKVPNKEEVNKTVVLSINEVEKLIEAAVNKAINKKNK
ncbi:hypothetical protein P344_03680 [Spiroplasma mirum ATCC 29335]|uniref:Uncharacterized protein n=1 Tax=Spiroplasma mirum ATCC 29335 TaxID=838561 RepID=W0GLI5_9MOLU|nr:MULTISPECIES: hypothetical protein [Spiroplasma]AHF61042.1 hypothetical protein SMM_0620 [Spiroplasma mirum ATCC 29335]AHI58077.1 hypothetical protein P344_03680 [Spiroplasma mirum ATCC 29335]AKM53145.1 hypothetical protein SATRI_v1c06830 [Spiroplasma atrichopogonis]